MDAWQFCAAVLGSHSLAAIGRGSLHLRLARRTAELSGAAAEISDDVSHRRPEQHHE